MDLRMALEQEGKEEEDDEETKEEKQKKAVAFSEALSAIPPSSFIPIIVGGGGPRNTGSKPDGGRGPLAMSVMPGVGLAPGFGDSPTSVLAQSVDVLV